MPEKFERCVQHIKDKGQADGVNPWAVCHASTGETNSNNHQGENSSMSIVDNLIHEAEEGLEKTKGLPEPKNWTPTKKSVNTGNTEKQMSETHNILNIAGVGKQQEALLFKQVLDQKLWRSPAKKRKA